MNELLKIKFSYIHQLNIRFNEKKIIVVNDDYQIYKIDKKNQIFFLTSLYKDSLPYFLLII